MPLHEVRPFFYFPVCLRVYCSASFSCHCASRESMVCCGVHTESMHKRTISESCLHIDVAKKGEGWGLGGGRSHYLLAFVVSPSTTHPPRDGVSLLLRTETPVTFLRPWSFFHTSHRSISRTYSVKALMLCAMLNKGPC